MCMSLSLKAGTNLPKNTCHHLFDWAQRGIWTDSASRMLLFAKITCCILGQQWVCVVFLSGIPLRLLQRRYQGPSSPPLFHLFDSKPSPISSSEIKSKHWGDRRDRCRLKWASGWAVARSICSLIKYLHCVNLLLLSLENSIFFLCNCLKICKWLFASFIALVLLKP